MKNLSFVLFFGTFFLLYSLAAGYVFHRGYQALASPLSKTIFSWVYWILFGSFFLGQFMERGDVNALTSVVSIVSSVWLAVFLYALLSVLLIDIIRLINHFIPFVSSTIFTPQRLFVAVAVLAFSMVAVGIFNAANPRVKEMDIVVKKSNTEASSLKIAMVSDIHMGFIIGNKHVARMVNTINEQNPDLVLLAGDLVDHNPKPVLAAVGQHFAQLKAPMGVFAVTGNHEYIGGEANTVVDYLSQYGVQYLLDECVQVAGVQIAGRVDRQNDRLSGNPRQELDSLLCGVDNEKAIILIDHQPVEYKEAQRLGVDLMLSGHTHYGQLWPFKAITRKVYDLDGDLMQRGMSQFYVSPGYGTWGPPVRLGNRPEVAIINVIFEK